jgi:hypothetical protein
MKENTRVAPSETVREYLPLASDIMPCRVPFSITLTPAIGVLSASLLIVPLTVLCAKVNCTIKIHRSKSKMLFF